MVCAPTPQRASIMHHATRHMCISDNECGPHLGISQDRRPLPIEAGAAIPERMESQKQGRTSAAHPQTSTSPMPLGVAQDASSTFDPSYSGGSYRPPETRCVCDAQARWHPHPPHKKNESIMRLRANILPVWTQDQKALGRHAERSPGDRQRATSVRKPCAPSSIAALRRRNSASCSGALMAALKAPRGRRALPRPLATSAFSSACTCPMRPWLWRKRPPISPFPSPQT